MRGVFVFILGMCYLTYTFLAFPLPLMTMFMPFCKLLRRTPSTEYMRYIFCYKPCVFFGHLKSMKKCRENPGFQSTKNPQNMLAHYAPRTSCGHRLLGFIFFYKSRSRSVLPSAPNTRSRSLSPFFCSTIAVPTSFPPMLGPPPPMQGMGFPCLPFSMT